MVGDEHTEGHLLLELDGKRFTSYLGTVSPTTQATAAKG